MVRGRTEVRVSRPALTLGVVGMMALPIFTAPAASAYAQTPSRTINGHTISGRFLEEWSRRGSDPLNIYINGLPITDRRTEISLEDGKPYEVQWFERSRYEHHPENPRPHDVLLGRLGAWDAEGRAKIDPTTGRPLRTADAAFAAVDRPSDLGPNKVWFPETRHTLSGDFLRYWNRYGGLPQFGFPLSEQFEETSRADGKSYTVQYFERARMELHPEKPEPYRVELGLLGVEQHRTTPIAGDDLPVAPPKGVTTTKDVIRIALSAEPADLSFISVYNSSVAARINSLIHDDLVGRDENENLFPLNAWYVPTLENGGARFLGEGDDRYLQVKYKLRRGIKWSDGKELTSNDAVFAYKIILTPETRMPQGTLKQVEMLRLQGVDNPDKHTVIYSYRSNREAQAFYDRVVDKENYGFIKAFVDAKKPVVSRLYSEIGTILPEHVLKDIPPEQILFSDYRRAPVGTGPWRIERWTTGQEIVLVPNEHYNLTAKPLIKRIEIKFVIDVGSLPLESYIKIGNLDLWTSESFIIPPADKAGIEAAGGRIVTRPAMSWEHLDFYMDYEPFKDRRVREAITTAINRQRIIDVAFRGSGGLLNGVIPSNVYFSLEHPDFARNYPDIAAKYKLPIYDYNPARSVQLLEDAGWRCPAGVSNTTNCDNRPREKGGVKLSFEYGTTINAVRQWIQGLVQADLKAVGVDAQIKSYPASEFLKPEGPWSDGTTKFVEFAWVGTENSDFGVWDCANVFNRGKNDQDFLNKQMYCNPALDEAHHRFLVSAGSEMVEAAAKAQVILMQDLPTIPLARRANVEVVNNKLQNHKLPNGLTSSFWNARQWYFK
jgi:peptide/nickel transport system substrate-binding protein